MSFTGISANRQELLQIAEAVAREKSIDKTVVIASIDPNGNAWLHRCIEVRKSLQTRSQSRIDAVRRKNIRHPRPNAYDNSIDLLRQLG